MLSVSRSRRTRVKVTLSFSPADHALLLPLIESEQARALAERKARGGWWAPKQTLSSALYRIVMRAASPPRSSRGQPARAGQPRARSSTRSKGVR